MPQIESAAHDCRTGPPVSCIELLKGMISINSVNDREVGRDGSETMLAQYLEHQAISWGLKTRRLPIDDINYNLLVYHTGSPSGPCLLFDSHLDTVATEGMTIDPFNARVEGNRIYGRGACDTKGSGAAMLWALKRYASRSGSKGNVAILFSVDEEQGKRGVRAFVSEQMLDLAWRPAAVVVGEPTGLKLVTATCGVIRWCIRTRGISAHSSNPVHGRSAITAMVKVVEALENHYIPNLSAEHPMVGKAQCSINMISGGTQINIIPGACEIHIDRRLVPGESSDQVMSEVEAVLDVLRKRDNEIAVEQCEPFVDPPLDPQLSREFISHVGEVLQRCGMCDQPLGVTYGTNASSFAEAGIPSIVLGPGNIAQAHSADEWLLLEQLHLGERVYYDLMCNSSAIVDDTSLHN